MEGFAPKSLNNVAELICCLAELLNLLRACESKTEFTKPHPHQSTVQSCKDFKPWSVHYEHYYVWLCSYIYMTEPIPMIYDICLMPKHLNINSWWIFQLNRTDSLSNKSAETTNGRDSSPQAQKQFSHYTASTASCLNLQRWGLIAGKAWSTNEPPHTSTNSHLHRPRPFICIKKHRTCCC